MFSLCHFLETTRFVCSAAPSTKCHLYTLELWFLKLCFTLPPFWQVGPVLTVTTETCMNHMDSLLKIRFAATSCA